MNDSEDITSQRHRLGHVDVMKTDAGKNDAMKTDAEKSVAGQDGSHRTSHATTVRLRRLAVVLAVVGVIAIVSSVLVMRFDGDISASIRLAHVPGDVRKAIELSEAFAHASGVTAILVCLLLASRLPRRKYWTAVAMTVIAGVTANLLKAIFVRPRPYTYDAVASDGAIGQAARDVTGWEFLGSGNFWDASHRSFPSGHTATAWGLAISLSCLYPRAAWMFCLMAALATYQRLYAGAHFPSDTLAGFGIACLTCGAILSVTRLRQNFIILANESESAAAGEFATKSVS